MPAIGSVKSTLLLSILGSTQRVCGFQCRRSAPHLACQAPLRRLLFPVRANVDLVASAAALGANHSASEIRHLGVGRIARHVDQGLVPAGIVKARRDEPLHAQFAYIAECHRRARRCLGLGAIALYSAGRQCGGQIRRSILLRLNLARVADSCIDPTGSGYRAGGT